MADLTTILQIAQIAITAAPTILNIVDRIRANPDARIAELREWKKESEEIHQKTLEKMEAARQSYEESVRRSQERADEEIRAQKEENRKALELIKNQAKEKEKEHGEAVRQMNEDHEKKMSEMRSDNKEARNKAELDHKIKMDQLKKEHDLEKKEAKIQLEIIKKERQEKIEALEKEKEEFFKMRFDQLENSQKEMDKLKEAHLLVEREVQQRIGAMKIENAKQRKDQKQIEHEKTIEAINHDTELVLRQLNMDCSRELLTHFDRVVEPYADVRNSLRYIKIHCGGELVQPGTLDPDFEEIKTRGAIFQNRVELYRKFVRNMQPANEKVLQMCNKYVSDMGASMDKPELLEITVHLRKAFDNGNKGNIEKYGNMAITLSDGFDGIMKAREEDMNQLTISPSQVAPQIEHSKLICD